MHSDKANPLFLSPIRSSSSPGYALCAWSETAYGIFHDQWTRMGCIVPLTNCGSAKETADSPYLTPYVSIDHGIYHMRSLTKRTKHILDIGTGDGPWA
jgi:hypothetical protein